MTDQTEAKTYILSCVNNLCDMWKQGLLGGETLPEDQNPQLDKGSPENYHYFTLPMALNYQRNSYMLWASAKQAYLDAETNAVFDPSRVLAMKNEELRERLIKYKVALQPTKQTEIWRRLCETICELYAGDIRNLFKSTNGHIPSILEIVQKTHKSQFPYISGIKICNYWLYIINKYTDAALTGREALNVVPDTHVLQASVRLGVISENEFKSSKAQQLVCGRWEELLNGTGIAPIDISTPLWLWSRGGFIDIKM